MLLLFANAVLRICIFRSFQYSTSPLQLVCVCIMNSKHSTYNSAACHKKMVLSVAPDRKKWCHFSAKSSTTPMFAVCRALRSPHAAWLTSANAIVVVDMACFCCLLTMSGQIRTNTAAFCFSTDAALNRLLVNFDFERPPLLLLPFASQCARNGQAVLLLNACLCNAHKHHSTYTEYTHINVRWVIKKKKTMNKWQSSMRNRKRWLEKLKILLSTRMFSPFSLHILYTKPYRWQPFVTLLYFKHDHNGQSELSQMYGVSDASSIHMLLCSTCIKIWCPFVISMRIQFVSLCSDVLSHKSSVHQIWKVWFRCMSLANFSAFCLFHLSTFVCNI